MATTELERPIVELVSQHAAEHPERVAIEDGARRLTYGDLNTAGARIAAGLLAAGVEDEEPVAVCLPRSWQAICSFLGVLRTGAVYVPIDPTYPPARQRQLLELAGTRLALTDQEHGGGLPPEIECLDSETLVKEGNSQTNIASTKHSGKHSGGNRLAYVLFTSGSTGTPKAVEVTHTNLVNLMLSSADAIPQETDAVLQVVPLSFDVSGLEIWGTLINGARLVIGPHGRLDPAELGGLITDRAVTMLAISTGLFHELVDSALPDLARLRLCVALGDVLSRRSAETLLAAHPTVRVLNGYGPTEATIIASSFELKQREDGPIPIGRALPGYHLYVLDDSGDRLGTNEPGELWIGGTGVARGYRGDLERTMERFRENPFDGGRMYRTGDSAMWRKDGELMFLGRLDDQVKIDGQRVEPSEVEQVLASNPTIQEAFVLAREDVPGHKHLAAYYVPRFREDPVSELREYMSRKLPAFMVPSTFVALDAMPRNERGKVDRDALPTTREALKIDEPDDPLVASVTKIFAEVLHLDAVGSDDDFFALGGTSLLALQLTGRLRKRLGATIDIRAVFDCRTPASLAERIDASPSTKPLLPPLRTGPRRLTAPVSAAQRRALLFTRMHPESIAYQFAAIFRFDGALNLDALREALGDLIRRHEILRTSFTEVDGEWRQVIHTDVPPKLDIVDLRRAPPTAWSRLVRHHARTRIDPSEPPLLRWTVAHTRDRTWRLLHIEHHLIHDGWSFIVFTEELAELYSARVEGRAACLPELRVQFQDYARWEREAHRGAVVAEQIERWQQRLDPDPPLLELPGARRRPARESFAGGSVRRRVDSSLVARLRALAHEHGVTLFMVAFAAFLAQLHRYSGRDDLQVGSGLANRRDPDAERLIGMIVNTVVLRCNLSGDPDVVELLRRVRIMAVDAYADADAPFEAVVEALRPRRDASRSPLIQTLFSFHDAPRGDERWAGLRTSLTQVIPNGTAKADLNVIGIPAADDGLTFVWEHSDLLDDAAVDRLAGHHVRLLEQFAERPEARLSEFDPIPPPERLELDRISINTDSFDRNATIFGLVAAQARQAPDATAVVNQAKRLTYRELLERASGVAAMLRERGVARGDRVGVLLNRSADSIVSQLGVLCAGAAYVPLDPQHPPARITAILNDGGVEIVLSDAELRCRIPVDVVALEVDRTTVAGSAAPVDATPTDLAYVIYTSGSTGEPKGVEVTHRNVCRLVDEPGFAELGKGTTMLHVASPAFDASTLEVWGPLANGGTVVCLGEQPSPDAIATAIERNRVTTLWLTAGLFHELVDHRLDCLSHVVHLLAGGDVLSPEHVRRALAALPTEGRLSNGYGPTETTTFATTFDLRPGDTVEGPIPIGHPIQATECRVLDADGNEQPIGAEGELAIGGDGVARGYRGDPKLTAARFVANPRNPSARLYLTGDRVRRRADGVLEFLGRADRQVKVRGVRVEPAEVESALRAHPVLADAAVLPFERAGDLALAAYVVASTGADAPSPQDLRAHAAQLVPTAMVPTAWIPLSELPLTPNGKLDRERLPVPGAEHLARQESDNRPPTRMERRVIKCFEKVLEVSPIAVEDDFFALGGHSLLAITLFEELEKIDGRLPLATIFEAPTPRALAALLEHRAPTNGWNSLVPLKPKGARPPLFVVAAGDGNLVGFGPLARHMPEEQPVYGLQPSGLDGRRPLDGGIEAMASRYLDAVRAVQPRGPYLLAGRCNGATVAFEMAQQLRAAGEDVPLLAALDSDPPPARPFKLKPGLPYDPMMEAAWIRARTAGEEVPDVEAPDGPGRLATWLRKPVGTDVTRYLYEAWHWREDLQAVWPDPLDADARSLAEWGWNHGREELDLAASLLQPILAHSLPWRERVRRLRPRGKRVATELSSELRARLFDEAERRLDRQLPEARQRIERHVVAAARRARASYRADPWPGRVVLISSTEFDRKPTYPAWEIRARGGVVRRRLPVGHVEMLREPGAALLAACLDECISEALTL